MNFLKKSGKIILNLQGSFSTKVKWKQKGKPQEHAYRIPPAVDKDDKDADAQIAEEEDDLPSPQDIALYINDYTAILALFSDKNNYSCENIGDCIKYVIELNCNKTFDEKLCDCERIPIPVLGCYMERIKGYSKKQFCASLVIFEEIIKDQEMHKLVNIIFGSIKEAMGKSSMLIYDMSAARIDEIIQKYLPVRKIEKDKYGEVFTPTTLINEMFDKLPKSVWKNKDLKWLDPANGTGNFPMLAYTKLMTGLEKEIPNKQKRSDHIIKNMLYMVELNPKNVAISRKIFGSDANIACANFLTEEDKWKKEFGGIDKFDIIMGNPPYNSGGIRAKTTQKVKRDQTKSKSIWPDFVKNSLTLLKNTNSYLLFIHPASWISLKSKNGDLIISRQLIYLRYYNYKEANLLFGNKSGKIPLTYYLMQNVKTKKRYQHL